LAKALGTSEAPTPEQLTSVLLQDSQKGRLWSSPDYIHN
jgi:hypothetical protein